jgi:hypothetical protein
MSKPSITVPKDEPPEASLSSGATPRMRAASLGPDPASPPAMSLLAGRRRPSREDGNITLPPELTPSPKAPKSEGSTDAASVSRSSSRNVSLDVDDSARQEAMLAVAAVAGCSAAAAASSIHNDGASGKDGDGGQSSEDDDDDSDGEDGTLLRMLRMRQSTSPQKRGGKAQGQRGSPAAAAFKSPPGQPGTPKTPAVEALPPEEGWDSVGSNAARRPRKSSSGAAGEGDAAAADPKAAAGDKASGSGGAGGGGALMTADDEEDNFFGSEYDAAKDGSRRQIGKHGRSVRQSVERNYAIEARMSQRGAR